MSRKSLLCTVHSYLLPWARRNLMRNHWFLANCWRKLIADFTVIDKVFNVSIHGRLIQACPGLLLALFNSHVTLMYDLECNFVHGLRYYKSLAYKNKTIGNMQLISYLPKNSGTLLRFVGHPSFVSFFTCCNDTSGSVVDLNSTFLESDTGKLAVSVWTANSISAESWSSIISK